MIVNISRLMEFLKCEQSYEYKYEKRLVPSAMDREALDFGTAIHDALAKWYLTESMSEAMKAYYEAIPEDHPMRGYGEVMIQGYCNTYASDWGVGAMKVLGAEQELEMKLPGTDITLVGRLDLIIETAVAGGTVWHMQHKTVGNTVGLDNYVRKYDLAWHERAYVMLARANGLNMSGTILNLLRKTKVPSFHRSYIPVSAELIERLKREIPEVVRRMENPIRLQNPDSCMMYNRLCPYHDLCLGLGDESGYERREPDYVDERRARANH